MQVVLADRDGRQILLSILLSRSSVSGVVGDFSADPDGVSVDYEIPAFREVMISGGSVSNNGLTFMSLPGRKDVWRFRYRRPTGGNIRSTYQSEAFAQNDLIEFGG